jgi:hypothetical protein
MCAPQVQRPHRESGRQGDPVSSLPFDSDTTGIRGHRHVSRRGSRVQGADQPVLPPAQNDTQSGSEHPQDHPQSKPEHRNLGAERTSFTSVHGRIPRAARPSGRVVSHGGAAASCRRACSQVGLQAPKWQGSSERCHLVGSLNPNLAAFGRNCPIQSKVASSWWADLRLAE